MEIKSGQALAYSANVKIPEKKAKEIKEEGVSDTQTAGQAKKTDAAPESATVTAKDQLNKGILEASMSVSLSAGNDPMALLYKTALEGVNKALEGELGPDAIKKTVDSGLDVSPQATADRIVQMSTAFFGKYQENHKDMDPEKALSSFTELISKGIDTGFKDARNILSGLNVLKEGNIGSNIDATYELVQKGLKAFADNYKKPDAEATPSALA